MFKKTSKTTPMFLAVIVTSILIISSNVTIVLAATFNPGASVQDPYSTLYTDQLLYNFTSPPSKVGTKFTVDVFSYNISKLYAYQVVIVYNASLINCTNAWPNNGWTDPDWVFTKYGTGASELTAWGHNENPGGSVPAGFNAEVVGDVHKSIANITLTDTEALMARFEFEILVDPPSYGELCTVLDLANAFLGGTSFNYVGGKSTSPDITNSNYSIKSSLSPPTGIVYVDPSRIVDPLLVPCNNFTVDVNVADATDLYSFEFTLNFDQSIVKAVEATLGDFFPPVSPTVVIDNVAGYLNFSASLTSPPSKSGNGTLAIIKFHVESLGDTDLHLSDIQLKGQAGQSFPYEAVDGYFNNVLVAKLYVDPPEIIDPTLMPPQTFSINVTIDDVENMYGYEFKLGFNSEVLICIGVTVHPILGEPHYIPKINIDSAMGMIWLNVTYYPPAVPTTTYSPAAIATITFRLKALGSSVLDLYDTNLVDDTGQPIAHETEDGFIMTLIQDIAILDVTPSENTVFQGFIANITIAVKNEGNLSETFDVNIYYDTTLIETHTVTDLAPNQTEIFIIGWNTTSVPPEHNYTISAEAPPLPYEIDTIDNVFEDGYIFIISLVRDVAVVDVTVSENLAYQGWTVDINVTVRNEGNLSETFDVDIYHGTILVGTHTVTDLAPNDTETTFVFSWDTTDVPPEELCHNYTISAEVLPLLGEIDTADNKFTDGYLKITLMGDVNGDGMVNVFDVAAVGAAFGAYPGHPRWDTQYDLNRDGIINIFDVAMTAANFGKTC